DGKVQTDFVRGTQTAIHLPGLLSFASVSVRGKDVYRVRPEQGMGLCRHPLTLPSSPSKKGQGRRDQTKPDVLSPAASICPPVLTRRHVVHGGLDGKLYVVPLDGGKKWSFATAFGAPITAPAAVSAGRIYVPCEDGYLYVLGPDGKAPLPTKDLQVTRIR